MVAATLKLAPGPSSPAPAPIDQPHVVREMAMQLVADRVNLSGDDDSDSEVIMSLHAAGWRWRQIKPHLDAAVLEAKQIILMREMGLEP